jgi:L-iditol 2-dehydrogenase
MGKNAEHYHPGLKIGDRVTADQIYPCGECKFCTSGRYWMCQPHKMHGYQTEFPGGMCEYTRYKKNAVISKVPEDMPFEQAVLIEPYGCSKHAVDRADIHSEDVCVISGAGTLGLGMVTYARVRNPKFLISLDMMDSRLKKAKEFGADIVMNPGKMDVVSEIKKLTDGYGCDIYIEATGNPASVIQGMSAIRKMGTFVEFSVFGKETTLDWSIIGDSKELDIRGSHLSPYAYPYVIDGIHSGKLKTNGVVTKILPLKDWEEGFKLGEGHEDQLKIAL